jgi:hypothetical protein
MTRSQPASVLQPVARAAIESASDGLIRPITKPDLPPRDAVRLRFFADRADTDFDIALAREIEP